MLSILKQKNRLALFLVIGLALAAGLTNSTFAQEDGGDEDAARQAYFDQVEADIAAGMPDSPLADMGATPCVNGFAGSNACENVDLLAFVSLASMGGGSGNDIWGWTDPEDGREYALVGRSPGTSFVDVTDPVNPIILGHLPTHTSSSTWRDIKVYADHAFIVSEASSHGMQVFDLTRLRDVINPPVVFTEDAHYPGFGNAHNLAINEDTGFAYAIGSSTCSGGLHMVNIQNPTAPTGAGCYSGDGYTHDTQCVVYNGPDTDYQGDEICFSSNEDSITITNVTIKNTPVLIKKVTYAGTGYTHQGWLTEDHVHFLMDDELDESSFGHNTRTRVFDMTNLDNPVLLGFFDSAFDSIDHNQYTLNGYVYQSNYSSGLQILDLAEVASGTLSRAGFFDTYSPNNNVSFNGSWSNFPYFESGIVVVNDINFGLYIVQPTLGPDYSVSASPTTLEACTGGEAVSTISLAALGGYTGTVDLSAVGLPAGSSAGFDPGSVVVPGDSELTVTVSTTPAGTYPFTVHADDGSIEKDKAMTLEVLGVAAAPGLVSPPDGALNVSLGVTFTWNAVAGATGYNIEVATDSGFTNVIDSATVAGTSYPVGVTLAHETTYYWHVSTNNECGAGAFSAAFDFTTEAATNFIYLPVVIRNP